MDTPRMTQRPRSRSRATALGLGRLLAAGVLLLAAPASAQRPGSPADDGRREVPEALVPVLNAAQRALESDDPRAALRILGTYEGDPDPLQRLLAGYAYVDLDQNDKAEQSFRAALELDDSLEQARTGLARSLVAQEKWAGAIEVLRGVVDIDRSPAIELALYARAAYEAGDLRLASLLAERGLLRFPEDVTLRRIDVEVLVRREAWSDALEAALGLLARVPDDELGWRQLAAAADRAAPELAVPALEAAAMVSPERSGLALRFARRLYEQGDYARVIDLVSERLRARRAGDTADAWRQLGVAAAVRAGAWKRAAEWTPADSAAADDLSALVDAHQKLEAGQASEALDLFARITARRQLPSDQLWTLVEASESAERPGLRTYFARATLARCDVWAPAAAAVLATQADRDLDPDILLRASCGGAGGG